MLAGVARADTAVGADRSLLGAPQHTSHRSRQYNGAKRLSNKCVWRVSYCKFVSINQVASSSHAPLHTSTKYMCEILRRARSRTPFVLTPGQKFCEWQVSGGVSNTYLASRRNGRLRCIHNQRKKEARSKSHRRLLFANLTRRNSRSGELLLYRWLGQHKVVDFLLIYYKSRNFIPTK